MAKGLLGVLAQAAQSESIWHNRPIRLTDGGFWGGFFGGQSSSGKVVNVDNAMKLSAVWSCVRIISTSIAGLPMGVYKRMPDGGRESARDFNLYDIVHNSPNEDMTAFQFWQAVVASMLLWGNAYCEVHRSGNTVVALDFLMPKRIRLDTDDNGRLTYWYTPKRGPERQIRRENMLHIPAFTLDGRVGLSAIRYGADVFGAAMSADDAANSTFKKGLMPTVAFKVDRILKPDQRAEFREYVRTVSGAMNAGESPVLEQGIAPEMIGINPNDAQLLESRGHSIQEVCRWFGVPPWMVGYTDKGSNWGTGLEQQMIAFLTFCISSITTQIQQCVNKRLMSPVDRIKHYAEFSLEGFLKADSAARAEFYSKMTQNGIYTRDDCRIRENLPRKGGNADVLTVQLAMAPLDSIGKESVSNETRALLNRANVKTSLPGFSEQTQE